MRNIKITIEYDGTSYHGWQMQENAKTVQGEIMKAIKKITGEEVNIIGAGRTDAGVHALGQVANFKTETKIPIDRIHRALNSVLPKDIVVKKAEEVDLSFHARYCAKEKEYVYAIYNSTVPSALWRNFTYHYSFPLDIEKMRKASKHFLGIHDFRAFMSTGSSIKDTVRSIKKLEIVKKREFVFIFISADGFLYNMVRIIAGTLLDVGIGKKAPEDIPKIIESGDRSLAGLTLPAHGLCLKKVYY